MPYCSEPQTQAVVANTLCVRIKSKSDDAFAMQCACCCCCSCWKNLNKSNDAECAAINFAHLDGDGAVAQPLAGDTVDDDVHLVALLDEVQRRLQHAHVRLRGRNSMAAAENRRTSRKLRGMMHGSDMCAGGTKHCVVQQLATSSYVC